MTSILYCKSQTCISQIRALLQMWGFFYCCDIVFYWLLMFLSIKASVIAHCLYKDVCMSIEWTDLQTNCSLKKNSDPQIQGYSPVIHSMMCADILLPPSWYYKKETHGKGACINLDPLLLSLIINSIYLIPSDNAYKSLSGKLIRLQVGSNVDTLKFLTLYSYTLIHIGGFYF